MEGTETLGLGLFLPLITRMARMGISFVVFCHGRRLGRKIRVLLLFLHLLLFEPQGFTLGYDVRPFQGHDEWCGDWDRGSLSVLVHADLPTSMFNVGCSNSADYRLPSSAVSCPPLISGSYWGPPLIIPSMGSRSLTGEG